MAAPLVAEEVRPARQVAAGWLALALVVVGWLVLEAAARRQVVAGRPAAGRLVGETLRQQMGAEERGLGWREGEADRHLQVWLQVEVGTPRPPEQPRLWQWLPAWL